MGMWRTIIAAVAILSILAIVYITIRAHRFSFIQRIAEKNKLMSWVLSLIPVGLSALFCYINVFSAVIVLLHLVLFWVICDLIGLVLRKTGKSSSSRYYAGVFAIALTVVYLSIGWVNAHDVKRTVYDIKTTKIIGENNLRIALIADGHLGITLNGKDFADLLSRIEADEPDLLIIAGDFIDDDTSKEDMLTACKAFRSFQSTYGVYFVYGNHDNGYYSYRSFSSKEFSDALELNGVHILRDETVDLGHNIILAGRNDRSFRSRIPADKLTQEIDHSKYIIMADHQPNDFFAETVSRTDLVLSGHTHGGHIWPVGIIEKLIKANDYIYGITKQELSDGHQTVFIVTSGISGWAIPFKTGTCSEYVIINISN